MRFTMVIAQAFTGFGFDTNEAGSVSSLFDLSIADGAGVNSIFLGSGVLFCFSST